VRAFAVAPDQPKKDQNSIAPAKAAGLGQLLPLRSAPTQTPRQIEICRPISTTLSLGRLKKSLT
jgi:hypothetical protein